MNLSMQFLVKLACECNLVWLNAARGGSNDEENERHYVFWPRASLSQAHFVFSNLPIEFRFSGQSNKIICSYVGKFRIGAVVVDDGGGLHEVCEVVVLLQTHEGIEGQLNLFLEIAGSNELAQQNFPLFYCKIYQNSEELDPHPNFPHSCPKRPRSCGQSGSRTARKSRSFWSLVKLGNLLFNFTLNKTEIKHSLRRSVIR